MTTNILSHTVANTRTQTRTSTDSCRLKPPKSPQARPMPHCPRPLLREGHQSDPKLARPIQNHHSPPRPSFADSTLFSTLTLFLSLLKLCFSHPLRFLSL